MLTEDQKRQIEQQERDTIRLELNNVYAQLDEQHQERLSAITQDLYNSVIDDNLLDQPLSEQLDIVSSLAHHSYLENELAIDKTASGQFETPYPTHSKSEIDLER